MAQPNQPVQVRMKLSGEFRMTITPCDNHTVDEVLEKLANRTAQVQGADIIEPRGGACEGFRTLAKIDVVEDHTLRTPWMR